MTPLHRALAILWSSHGEPMEKNAAAHYFYQLRKPSLDRDALGHHFCKVAEELHQDPWALANSVDRNLRAFKVLAKTASDPRTRRLANYYVGWAEELEKRAFLGTISKGIKTLAGRGAKAVKGFFGKGAPGAAPGATTQAAGSTAKASGTSAARTSAPGMPKPIPEPGGPVAGNIPTTRAQWRAQEVAARQGQAQRAAATPKPGAAERASAQQQAVLQKTGPTKGPNTPEQQAALKKRLLEKQQRLHGEKPTAQRLKQIQRGAPGGYTLGNQLLGGGLLAGTAAAPFMLMGGGQEPQPQYQGGYGPQPQY